MPTCAETTHPSVGHACAVASEGKNVSTRGRTKQATDGGADDAPIRMSQRPTFLFLHHLHTEQDTMFRMGKYSQVL